MDEIFDTLRSRSDERGFTQADGSDVDRWANELDLTPAALLDQIGVEIAKRYDAGRKSFEFCDSLVNELWGVLIERVGTPNEIPWPNLFHEVYEAFDAGEFHRLPDMSDNPIADFTDPLIAEIVKKL